VDNDGSPRGDKIFMLWNPPIKPGSTQEKQKGYEEPSKQDIEREREELQAELDAVSQEEFSTDNMDGQSATHKFYQKQQKLKRIKKDLSRLKSAFCVERCTYFPNEAATKVSSYVNGCRRDTR
jgi:hypothetical protein